MTINIQLRRDSASNWAAQNPVLASSELTAETNTRKIKIGDGATPWNLLPYAGTLGPPGIAGAPNSIVGTLAYFPTATAPAGWLRADGSFISEATYPGLAYLLQNTSTQLATPTSISTEGAYTPYWIPNLAIFSPYTDSNLYNSGEYLSTYVQNGEQFTAFSFGFDQPVVLSALTTLAVGYGVTLDYWKLMSGSDIIAQTPNLANDFLQIGGVNTYSNDTKSFVPNWYNLNNTLARQNYTLIVSHADGYTVDVGISRLLFQQTIAAPGGFKILPTLPVKSAGLLSLYPYIKT
jgi:hypothetical protein